MHTQRTVPFRPIVALASVFFLALLCPSRPAIARDLIVEHNPTDPSHFSTIQSAITYVTSQTGTTTSFRIIVEPSSTPYGGPITPISNVPIIGRETARTIISGNSAGTLINVSEKTNVTIRNFTIINAAIGISVVNNSTIVIAGNVFQVGTGGTAVSVENSPSAQIINNTFYQNGTAVNTNSNIPITNNIFSTNGTAISGSVPLNQATYNAYHVNTNIGVALDINSLPNATVTDPDPLFVAPANRDYHLKAGSPCHSYGGAPAGNPSYQNRVDSTTFDMGAYGGLYSDTIPVPVKSVVATGSTSTAPPYSIAVTWAADLNYQVKGYKLYYGYTSGNYTGNDAVVSGQTGTSPIDAGNVAQFTLDGLSPAVATPAVPALNIEPQPRNQGLILSWTSVPNATRYDIYYALASAPSLTFSPVNAGNTTSYHLTGLVNGEIYNIGVKAVSQATYYVVVTSYTSTNTSLQNRGVDFESAYSAESVVPMGPASESGLSNVVTGLPELLVPYPNLPNTGCFIATAAYGSRDAFAVKVLRDFRDRYLQTKAGGRAFVRWYYSTSPPAARFITEHPALKPVVRTALAPVVAGAFLLTETSPAVSASVLFLMPALTVLLLRWKQRAARRTPCKERYPTTMIRTFLLFILILTFPAATLAADQPQLKPHWSLEVKGGYFYPDVDNWKTYYGEDRTWHYAGSLAYKVLRQVELGIEAGYIKDRGLASAPLNSILFGRRVLAGRVDYELAPLNVFVLFRGVFKETQWLVPYAGGGWTRMHYRVKTEGQDSVRGSADGYHGRAGLQFLLDEIDPRAAHNLYADYGVHHTYLFAEVQVTDVTVGTPSINIGGTSYLAGLLFEF